MSHTTKQDLEASLKKLLLEKPLDKITIQDLTNDCGISRMAFYYHFKDIYDLVEWSCLEDATKALQGKKTYATWQEGLRQIFEAVLANKPFILNAYHSISREQIENYLFKLTYALIADAVSYTHLDVYKRQAFPQTDPPDVVRSPGVFQTDTLFPRSSQGSGFRVLMLR